MKAEELRIGNYVERGGMIFKASFGTIEDWFLYPNLIRPVPITEERLKDLGFENNELNTEHLTFHFHGIDNLAVHGMLGTIKPLKCAYLHQLQNIIFDLSGVELKFTKSSKNEK